MITRTMGNPGRRWSLEMDDGEVVELERVSPSSIRLRLGTAAAVGYEQLLDDVESVGLLRALADLHGCEVIERG